MLPNPSGLEPKVDAAIDEILAPLQARAGQVEAFGRWVDVPYSAGHFGCSVGGTWAVHSGDVQVFQYTVFQNVMFLRVVLFHTTTASMGNQLFVPSARWLALPGQQVPGRGGVGR